MAPVPSSHDRVPTWVLAPFLVLTFMITWCSIGMYILFPDWAADSFGEISGSHPVFFLATWAPAIAARRRGPCPQSRGVGGCVG